MGYESEDRVTLEQKLHAARMRLRNFSRRFDQAKPGAERQKLFAEAVEDRRFIKAHGGSIPRTTAEAKP